MTRFLSDQNKLVGLYESGLYGTIQNAGSVFWIGQVQSHSLDETENLQEIRYLGNASRSFALLQTGTRDYKGTISYNPSDMRIVFWGIGSVYSTSGTNSSHTATEINTNVAQSAFVSGTLNPPNCFTLEDSKAQSVTGKNFIRTLNGCVPNTITITTAQGEKVSVDVDYIASTLTYSSGAATSVTADGNRSYLWSDASLTMAGSVIDTAKEITLEINQNVEGPHYINASRDISTPYPLNREYTLSLTMDADSERTKMFYDQYFRGGSVFNATLDFNADAKTGVTGSLHSIFIMSGCNITEMDNPSEVEGINEMTITVRPKNLNATEYNRISKFNPW